MSELCINCIADGVRKDCPYCELEAEGKELVRLRADLKNCTEQNEKIADMRIKDCEEATKADVVYGGRSLCAQCFVTIKKYERLKSRLKEGEK